MTPDELIATLSPSRLPPSVLVLDWRAALALVGLGLLAGLVLLWLASPFLTRRRSRAAQLRALLHDTKAQDGEERLLALARLIGQLPEGLRPAAYGAAPVPDDAEIVRQAKAAGRSRSAALSARKRG
ncbi:hypothetical protein QWZ10_14665 [Paracoccus cavernae]|uniref:Uncharacterized protein n=1 Tax=Paracoccus cavernae TaxID=1571207 RepID=A0ABT8DB36_9RHOB|nr:hypothetical protein [Paracoccus cavernae]